MAGNNRTGLSIMVTSGDKSETADGTDGAAAMAGGRGESRLVRHDISIVIPTVGRTILQKCLASIAAGRELPKQLIVVDQSSDPAIAEWLHVLHPLGVETRHVLSSKTGRAAGVNLGIECADTELVAITDDDCLVAEDWLRHMRSNLRADPGIVVTGRVEATGDEEVPITVTSMAPAIFHRPRLKFDSLCGGNMGVALKVMDRVGPLDEDQRLRNSEDGEWAYRALRAGVSIKYAPDVVVHHYGWRNIRERQEQYRAYAKSHGAFFGKYMRAGDWFIGLRALVHYLRELRRYLKGIVTGNREETRMAWACLRWLPPGVLAGLRSRAPRPARRAKAQ